MSGAGSINNLRNLWLLAGSHCVQPGFPRLLHAVGRDCVGAVQLLPPGATTDGFDQMRYEALTPEQIEKHLGAVGSQAGAGAQDDEEGFQLSIAGARKNCVASSERPMVPIPRRHTHHSHTQAAHRGNPRTQPGPAAVSRK